MKILFFVIGAINVLVTNGKLLPLECKPSVAPIHGLTFCGFNGQKSSNRDVTRIHVLPATFQGQTIEIGHQTFVLYYSNCTFDRIPKIYKFFTYIKRVQFIDSTIKEIDSSDFTTGSMVKELVIKNSKIEKIGELAFEWLINLEEIEITDCEIGEIDENAFYGAKSLKKVTFKDNYVEKGDESRFRMPNRKVKFINSD